MKYQIRYALGGGFGGCEMQDWEDCDADTMDEAESFAYEEACQIYESYDGMHGLQSAEDIRLENPDWDDDSVEAEWREQREGWLDYEAREKP
jgi:hypothetical protein